MTLRTNPGRFWRGMLGLSPWRYVLSAAVSTFVVAGLMPGSAAAADWFVDAETGNDVANLIAECPQASPCATIGPPIGLAGPGDTVKVDDSTTDYQTNNLGIGNGHSVIGTNFVGGLESGDGRPVINNSGGAAARAFTIGSVGNVRNLRIRPNGGTGILITTLGLGTVADNVFEDTGANADDIGINHNGNLAPLIENNTFTGLNVGVFVQGGAAIVKGNDISGTQDGGGGGLTGAGILVFSIFATNPDLVANRIHDAAPGSSSDGIRLFQARADLERNQISGYRKGVNVQETPGVVTLSGDQLVGASHSGLEIVDGNDDGDAIVTATNVTAVADAAATLGDVSVIGGTLTLDSSIVGAPGSSGMSATGVTPVCTIGFSRGPTTTPGGNGCANFQTTADPLFVGVGDFHLQAPSPLIDAGNPADPATGATDIDGEARKLNGAGVCRRDIGADEFAGSGSCSGTVAVDTTAPDIDIAAKKSQKAGKAIKIAVSCNEACSVLAQGVAIVKAAKSAGAGAIAAAKKKQKFKLIEAGADFAAAETKTLKLKPKGKKTARKLKKAVKRGGKGKATITVTATDAAGNQSSDKLTVKLKK